MQSISGQARPTRGDLGEPLQVPNTKDRQMALGLGDRAEGSCCQIRASISQQNAYFDGELLIKVDRQIALGR